MTSQSQSQAAGGMDASNASRPHKHVHHGRTTAAWTGSVLAMAAFVLGGIAMVLGPNWLLFWIAVAILVLSMIAAKVLQVMGYGAN
jgi:cytosine/uracil/thiamine/allantoin permease